MIILKLLILLTIILQILCYWKLIVVCKLYYSNFIVINFNINYKLLLPVDAKVGIKTNSLKVNCQTNFYGIG